MPALISCQEITKSYRFRPLFKGLTFAIEEKERLGIIGPNGSGKSTLLKIMAGLVEPDEGVVAAKKGMRAAYIAQDDEFQDETVGQVLLRAVEPLHLEEHDRDARIKKLLTKTGFADPAQLVDNLSGGWRKRLAIISQLILEPDLLLLDEPTNHLDLEGVLWLESFLAEANFAFALVSHDRSFLENVTTRLMELNPGFADGFLSVEGNYSNFLIGREEYFTAQAHLEQAISSKVRREVAWLQRGARARQTKAQARIKEAERLIDSLAEVKFRNQQNQSVDIEFDSTGRKTKELLVAKGLKKAYGERVLFKDVDITLRPKSRLGLVGANGSGKTTLLRILAGQLAPDAGTIKRADRLQVVWFDQNREQLNPDATLWKSLCPDGDSVHYQGRMVHVSTWAKRFLFKSDQLKLPTGHLSGGEQARILIANLMRQPADVLILDEPTNDLDIPSLEVLEESLLEFPGAIILVTHDRFMLNAVTSKILVLDGKGSADYFIDFEQFESNLAQLVTAESKPKAAKTAPSKESRRRGLSTAEKRELTEMEQRIHTAEAEVIQIKKRMEDPFVASDHVKLQQLSSELEQAEQKVHQLYDRWQDLELRSAE